MPESAVVAPLAVPQLFKVPGRLRSLALGGLHQPGLHPLAGGVPACVQVHLNQQRRHGDGRTQHHHRATELQQRIKLPGHHSVQEVGLQHPPPARRGGGVLRPGNALAPCEPGHRPCKQQIKAHNHGHGRQCHQRHGGQAFQLQGSTGRHEGSAQTQHRDAGQAGLEASIGWRIRLLMRPDHRNTDHAQHSSGRPRHQHQQNQTHGAGHHAGQGVSFGRGQPRRRCAQRAAQRHLPLQVGVLAQQRAQGMGQAGQAQQAR